MVKHWAVTSAMFLSILIVTGFGWMVFSLKTDPWESACVIDLKITRTDTSDRASQKIAWLAFIEAAWLKSQELGLPVGGVPPHHPVNKAKLVLEPDCRNWHATTASVVRETTRTLAYSVDVTIGTEAVFYECNIAKEYCEKSHVDRDGHHVPIGRYGHGLIQRPASSE